MVDQRRGRNDRHGRSLGVMGPWRSAVCASTRIHACAAPGFQTVLHARRDASIIKVGHAIWRRWSVKGRRSSSSWKPRLGWRGPWQARRARHYKEIPPFCLARVVRARVLILRVRALASKDRRVSSLGQLTLSFLFPSNPSARGPWKWTINDGPLRREETSIDWAPPSSRFRLPFRQASWRFRFRDVSRYSLEEGETKSMIGVLNVIHIFLFFPL